MSEQLKALYDLQCIDLQIAKLQKAKAALGDGSALKQQVEEARRDAEAAEKSLHEATTELRDNELNLKTVESKTKTYQDKLYAGKVSNPKELTSIEKEIEMLERQKGKLEEGIIALMDTIEARKSANSAAQGKLKSLEEELSAQLADIKVKTVAINTQGREVVHQREKALAAVDPAMLKKYDSLKVRQGGVVVSKVVDGDCSACHTQVISGNLKRLTSDAAIQCCENCSRMLYLE